MIDPPIAPLQPIGDTQQIEVSRQILLWSPRYRLAHVGMIALSEDDERGDLHVVGYPQARLDWDDYSHWCYVNDPDPIPGDVNEQLP